MMEIYFIFIFLFNYSGFCCCCCSTFIIIINFAWICHGFSSTVYVAFHWIRIYTLHLFWFSKYKWLANACHSFKLKRKEKRTEWTMKACTRTKLYKSTDDSAMKMLKWKMAMKNPMKWIFMMKTHFFINKYE